MTSAVLQILNLMVINLNCRMLHQNPHELRQKCALAMSIYKNLTKCNILLICFILHVLYIYIYIYIYTKICNYFFRRPQHREGVGTPENTTTHCATIGCMTILLGIII